jgi:hypothetical protein
VRALRGTAAAWIAVVLAATAHTLAGGGPPSPAIVAAVGILAAPFAVALAGRRLALWRVGATVLASQAIFHVAFALTAGADPAAAHGHHLTHLGGGPGGVVLLPDAPMLIAHVLAAVATVGGLYGGERMLRALGRGIRCVFTRAVDVGPRAPLPRQLAVSAGPRRTPARTVLSDLSRRGPPAFV